MSLHVQEFSLLYVIHTGSGAQPASYLLSIGGSFPGIKRPGGEADRFSPTGAAVKNTEIYGGIPHTPPLLSA
jgi:hypothetical protein